MKKITFRFCIVIMTLFIGLFSVNLYLQFSNNRIQNAFFNIEENELKEARIVTIAPKPPRFAEFSRACGMGYVQRYITNDGIYLSEGNLGCKKPKKQDKNIVKKDDERIISKFMTGKETYYEIYQLKSGHCINAPTLELALEFEDWNDSLIKMVD